MLCVGMMGDPPTPLPDDLGSDAWDYELDITALASAKLAAIGCHGSQLPGGNPEALFPGTIVRDLLAVERYVLADGSDPAEAFFAAVSAV
jgi:hypothetical protein